MKIVCPASTCRAENDIRATLCVNCGISLQEYIRLSLYPAVLFNAGLQKARQQEFAQARDLFAAVVYWCPQDREARNALAAACLELDDRNAAEQHWQEVLRQNEADSLALQGLSLLKS